MDTLGTDNHFIFDIERSSSLRRLKCTGTIELLGCRSVSPIEKLFFYCALYSLYPSSEVLLCKLSPYIIIAINFVWSGLYIGISPFTFPAEEGVTRVKVLPDPDKCRGTCRPYVFELAD